MTRVVPLWLANRDPSDRPHSPRREPDPERHVPVISCTFDIERTAAMPFGASTGALGAVCPPVAPAFGSAPRASQPLGLSYAIPACSNPNAIGMGTDWAKRDRHVGIVATTRLARHLRRTPT